MALWLPCLLASVRWSVDPVTRATVGTFSIGQERMFRVIRISGECCGYGHDALAYNLQYTALGRVLDKAMMELQPGDSTVIVKTLGELGLKQQKFAHYIFGMLIVEDILAIECDAATSNGVLRMTSNGISKR